jgi:hypothetical protein
MTKKSFKSKTSKSHTWAPLSDFVLQISVLWIRIRIDFGRLEPDLDPGGQKLPTKKRKSDESYWFECKMFSFEGWRLLLWFGRLLWRPRINILKIFDQKYGINFLSIVERIFKILVLKSLEPDQALN